MYALARTNRSIHILERRDIAGRLSFGVMETAYEAKRIERQLREAQCIKRLGTARPDGCNVKDAHIQTVYELRSGGLFSEFSTRADKNLNVQPHKMAKCLVFGA